MLLNLQLLLAHGPAIEPSLSTENSCATFCAIW